MPPPTKNHGPTGLPNWKFTALNTKIYAYTLKSQLSRLVSECYYTVQVIGDEPSLQHQQPGVENADANEPQYAELAPSRRRTQEQSRVVDNSTAVYAHIVHPPRTSQSWIFPTVVQGLLVFIMPCTCLPV